MRPGNARPDRFANQGQLIQTITSNEIGSRRGARILAAVEDNPVSITIWTLNTDQE